ncbi:hypothetical protein BDQ12DRAFT_700449 [Crucibulum laeve]|uniref:Uncharacterized protein n=1 Tax=Crucibulum laeve TaxID=68775 RepID=A0A5C3LQB7_9AGAR|nr:hypothetical protein BDQ12DRAFT_700449 [Crucibulum laeve]
MVDSLVFEETIDDYATVLAEAHPRNPSTLELLEATLPELLPEPLPEDASIFENASDYDYRADSVALTAPSYPSDYTLSTHTLMQLLMAHKIDEAYNLLLELNDLHVPIPPSSIFEAAAKDVLHNSLQSGSQLITQDQIDRFQAFFSLIPPAHLSDTPRQFRELRKLTIDTQLPNMVCIIRFAVILSSKGYADLIINHAVAPIMRFTSSAVNRKFLDDFLAANREYWASYKPSDLEYMVQKTRTNVFGSAIRTLVYSRRLEDALALLPDPTQETYRLTVYTYGVLRSALEKSSDRTLRGRISEIDALRENEKTCVLVEREKGDNLTIRAEEVSMASEWDTAAPVDVNKNLALSLRYLKRCMSGSEELPHPFTIVAFMESYISTGRTTALQLLLNKAIRSSFRSTSVFLFAEMLFYRRRGLNDLVLETFVDHFYLSGVPRQDVLTRHRRVQRVRAQHAEESEYGEDSPARRLCEAVGLSRGKIWPSTVHCNLVWHALVDIAPDNRTIESLYEKLLAITKCAQSNVSTPLLKDSISHLLPPTNQQKLGSGAFTSFMRPLMLVHGPSRGAHILGDMMKVGIKPTVYHFTELAGRYASNGDTRRALMVLDRMEKMLKAQNAAESSTEMITDPEDTSTSFPAPDLVMYISLLRGFIKSHNLEGATEVEKRLMQRYTHIPGEYAYLDNVFADLRILRKQKGLFRYREVLNDQR